MNYAAHMQNITWPAVVFVGIIMAAVVLVIFILAWATRR